MFGIFSSGAGHYSRPEAHTEARDLAWSGDPEVLAMLQHIVERSTQRLHAEGLSDDEGMHRNSENKWIFHRASQHFLELVNNHLFEFLPCMMTKDQRRTVVHLQRVRD